MLGSYPDEPQRLYEPCRSCQQPKPARGEHQCAIALPGQTWWSMNRMRHPDTVFFSHRLPGHVHVESITVWQSRFVNGFQLTLRDLASNIIYTSQEKWGDHNSPDATTVTFEPTELITRVGVRAGDIIDQFWLETSRGRRVEFGGSGGSEVPVVFPDKYVVVGIFGGLGGHVHNIGFYLDETSNLTFERRRIYFLVRFKAEKTQGLMSSVIGLLVKLTPDTFRDVLQYL